MLPIYDRIGIFIFCGWNMSILEKEFGSIDRKIHIADQYNNKPVFRKYVTAFLKIKISKNSTDNVNI